MPRSEGGQAPAKRLGVLGTLVRDTIHPPGAAPVGRCWGGIAYALAALDHVVAPRWSLVPAIKLGADLAGPGQAFLGSLARVGDLRFVRVVPEPNNRVELRYRSQTERLEILSGGVPGWEPNEIDELLETLDALYVNFIAGNEMTLAGARRIRDRMQGPGWADLHSLFLESGPGGERIPRRLPSSVAWARCFDTVQMNESEFALFAADDARAGGRTRVGGETRAGDDSTRGGEATGAGGGTSADGGTSVGGATRPRGITSAGLSSGARAAVAAALGGRLATVAVTRGGDGVEIFRKDSGSGSAPRRELVAVPGGGEGGDPTGCGDIWGATCFAGLLDGMEITEAARRANRVARRNLACTGAGDAHASLGDSLGGRP